MRHVSPSPADGVFPGVPFESLLVDAFRLALPENEACIGQCKMRIRHRRSISGPDQPNSSNLHSHFCGALSSSVLTIAGEQHRTHLLISRGGGRVTAVPTRPRQLIVLPSKLPLLRNPRASVCQLNNAQSSRSRNPEWQSQRVMLPFTTNESARPESHLPNDVLWPESRLLCNDQNKK